MRSESALPGGAQRKSESAGRAARWPLATGMCVHLTVMDAYMRGYRLWVPRDCTAAESEAARDAALRQMAYFKCTVVRKSA